MVSFLTAEERKLLLKAAREAIEAGLQGSRPARGGGQGGLAECHGAFVTLTRDGRLRGCIGFVFAERPLLDTVREAAQAAAFHDPRFPPLRASELPEIRLELSVLSEPTTVSGLEEIQVGRHGLIVRRGSRSGLLLPQVATERDWSALQFLDALARKTGVNYGAYREPSTKVYVFRAQIIQ